MDMELLLLYAPCCLVLVLSSLYLLGLYADSRRNLPPGPRPLPLVGSLFSLGALPHRSMARLAECHGPVMALRLGTVTTIVASSADAARDVLQRHDAAFSGRSLPDSTHALAHYTHSMVWLPTSSPRWRALRKVCSGELFAPHRLDTHQSLRRDKVRQLVSHVALLARDGAPVAVARLAFVTALNLLSSTIFSTDLADIDIIDDDSGSSPSSSFKGVLAELNATAGLTNVSDFFPEVARLDPQGLRRRIESLFQRLHAMMDKQIERRLQDRVAPAAAAGPKKEKDFLDVLLDYRGAEDGRGFDRQTLLSLLSDLFSAGTDTSAATVEWVMAELLLNPSSMAKARAELAQVIGSKPEVEESDIAQLKYLQAIVKETFRIHPPAPLLLPHQAETRTQIRGGYTVPKGARVVVNVWAIGHDGKVWPEPDKFMPERFLVAEDDEKAVDFRGRDFELLPFGSGRRMCPGMPLALRMVHLMLASLLHRFEWSLLPPADDDKNELDMTERLGLNLSMATPLQAMATPV
ncbi:geraniol 8-hydroxylase-like [Miscanthus floridulus]|uniref:geraniol 8-hydroxylase-like n=1 Tax=Miscanthus floridulus TaxID=154761 RepID=UPI003458029E